MLNNIMLQDIEWNSKALDHYGIVAGCCTDLDIAGRIDKLIYKEKPIDPRRKLSAGLSAVAMVINGLGFTNRRMYLASQFFETKPVELLLNKPGLKSDDITDDALGKALDEIAEYGAEKLFGNIATSIVLEYNLRDRLFHVDTTSISTTDEYSDIYGGDGEYVEVTYGKSKDNKPDCKQVVMSLVVNGSNGIPLWCSPCDGNASDKATLYETIKTVKEFCAEVDQDNRCKWVADAALYNQNNLLKDNSFNWLSRVPETITEAKELIQTKLDNSWLTHGNGYSSLSISSTYGGIKQKWLLIYSEQGYQRELKTFNRNLAKQEEQLNKDLWHFGNEEFICENDLNKALAKLCKKHKYFTIQGTVVEVKKYAKPGKPKLGELPKIVGYKYNGVFVKNKLAIDIELNKKGKFILATNDLDPQYSNEQMLADYKDQQYVEQGFRFLKDPWFLVQSIFLKSRKRITALMMIMALCLFIYNFAQHKLRNALVDKNETLPNQLKKQIQNPTMRWIFQLMEGIHMVYLKLKTTSEIVQETVSNIDELRRKIILLFGGLACMIYAINESDSTN